MFRDDEVESTLSHIIEDNSINLSQTSLVFVGRDTR